MFTYKTLTTQQYIDAVVNLISSTEGHLQNVKNIGDGKATIGYGYTFNRNDNVSLWQAAGITLTDSEWAILQQIDSASSSQKTAMALDLFSKTLTFAEAKALLEQTYQKYESPANELAMPMSWERVALVSITYNRGEPAVQRKMQDFYSAINTGDRAEAWFQIRYNAQTSDPKFANGIAKRRYYESETFGLYDNPGNVSDAEYKSALQMYTRHQQAIEIYEKQYGVWNGQRGTKLDGNGRTALEAANQDFNLTNTPLQVDSLQQELKPARDRIIQTELTHRGITTVIDGDILIGQDTDYVTTKQTWSQNDNLTGGDKNDLILGGEGNDTLESGQGNDILQGGLGHDTYIWNTGDGTDTIIDEDKQAVIKINHGAEQDLYALGAFIETTPGSNVWQKTMADDSLLTLTHHSPWRLVTTDGSEIILGDDWQPGDFGIHTVTQSSVTTHLTVTGDFKPLDQDPNAEGRQISYDALGNLITDPEQPDPGRQDTLYDSTGNDSLKGFAGNDNLDAKRGGNDLLEGGAGSDILDGGGGGDNLFGDLTGSASQDWEVSRSITTRNNVTPYTLTYAQAATDSNPVGGADNLYGGAGNDWLFGNRGDDILAGDRSGTDQGEDYLDGGNGSDTLLGGDKNDMLLGGAGLDYLFGESGDDSLHGGADADELSKVAGMKCNGIQENRSLDCPDSASSIQATRWTITDRKNSDGSAVQTGQVSDRNGVQTVKNVERFSFLIGGASSDTFNARADNNTFNPVQGTAVNDAVWKVAA